MTAFDMGRMATAMEDDREAGPRDEGRIPLDLYKGSKDDQTIMLLNLAAGELCSALCPSTGREGAAIGHVTPCKEMRRLGLSIAGVMRRMQEAIDTADRPFTHDVQEWLAGLRGEWPDHPMPPDIDKGRKQA